MISTIYKLLQTMQIIYMQHPIAALAYWLEYLQQNQTVNTTSIGN